MIGNDFKKILKTKKVGVKSESRKDDEEFQERVGRGCGCLPTPPHKQNATTLKQIFTGLNSEFFFSKTCYHTNVKEHSQLTIYIHTQTNTHTHTHIHTPTHTHTHTYIYIYIYIYIKKK